MNPSTWMILGGIVGIVMYGQPQIHPIRDLRQHRQNVRLRQQIIDDAWTEPPHEGIIKLLFPEDDRT